MATAGKTKKEKKKPVPVKTSLKNPYKVDWVVLTRIQKEFIMKTLQERLEALGLRKTPVKVKDFRSKRKAKKRASEAPEAEKVARQPGWSDEGARRQLAIGLNEVTKCLERNELSLVLVCSSATPAHMTSHLIPLSKTRGVPACQVHRLSEGLSGLLGVGSVLALGFRRGGKDFADTVGQIAAKVPPLNVPWISAGSAPTELEGESQGDPVQSEEQRTDSQLDPVTPEGSLSDPAKTKDDRPNPPKGKKRKLDFSPEPAEELKLSLQPLKVRKTIPNPSKIRKPKKKKNAQKK
ncbi:hypothetical protein NFI96_001889 [Prochilodus magdalenae]|nr:hypothetical protein NFI96_001889 [Prochilodus magdalenae]